MTTAQGSVALLDDPVAQRLLQSKIPARLAYNWSDGTPRIVPIWFHWNGHEIVLSGPPDAPKMNVLKDGTRVALSIDTDTMPCKVLMIRGSIRTDIVEGVAPEYEAATRRMLGDEAGQAWIAQMAALSSRAARIFITPDWVGIIDFETRFPSAVERAMEHAQASA